MTKYFEPRRMPSMPAMLRTMTIPQNLLIVDTSFAPMATSKSNLERRNEKMGVTAPERQ